MKVKKIMQAEVATCSTDAPIAEAARIMWENDCGTVPVVDEGHLTGIVTDRDICMAALMTGLPLGLIRVREVMTADVFTCDPDDEISAAHALMREQQVRRLPVVDEEEQVVGIVSLNDLANEAFTGKSKAAAKRQRDMARTFAAIAIHHENGIAEGEEVEA